MKTTINDLLAMSGARIGGGLDLCLAADISVGDPSIVTRLILLADDLHAYREDLAVEARAHGDSGVCAEYQAFALKVDKFCSDAAEYAALCAGMVALDRYMDRHALAAAGVGSRFAPTIGMRN